MTKINNPYYVPMMAPEKFSLPFKASHSRELLLILVRENSPAFVLFSQMHLRLIGNDDIMQAMTVDCSFIKKEYHRNTYTPLIRYLMQCNIIVRIGGQKSWHYMVNPAIAHCMKFEQQQEVRARYRSLFVPVKITAP